jgi:two-component system, LytTR family, response regulator
MHLPAFRRYSATIGREVTNVGETSQRTRTLVVDDEPLARNSLTILLRRDPMVEIVGECGSGADAVIQIRSLKPDLVFLDVQMPEVDGFDVVEMLGRDLPAAIVFVTAYDQYALRAFEAGALDYILKPFDDARFTRALERAKTRIAASVSRPPAAQPLVVKSAGHISFIKVPEIDWIEAADYYSSLHTGRKTHLLRRSMTDLEQELDQTLFCRIHRSTIVNLNRVRDLQLSENGEYDVLLNDGTRLRLSRRYRKQLLGRLGTQKTTAILSSP